MFHLCAYPFFRFCFLFRISLILIIFYVYLSYSFLLFFFFFVFLFLLFLLLLFVFFLCSSPSLSFSSCTSPTCPPPPQKKNKKLKHRFVLTEQKNRAGFRSLPGKCCVGLATTKFWKSSFTRFPLSKIRRFLTTPTLAMATYSPNTPQNVHTSMTPTWLPKWFQTPIFYRGKLTWIVS